jgi:hypothetical protein
MVFIFDRELTNPTSEGPDLILLASVGVGAFVAGVAVTHITYRRREALGSNNWSSLRQV